MGSFDPIAYFFAKKAMKIAIPKLPKLSLLEIDVDKDWSGKRITNVGAPLTSNDVPRARAEDILSGVFSPDRIPNLDAGKITSGIFDIARIPDLDASKIVSGTLNPERIPSLLRAKISDFWDAPFWPNIPDKPNAFPPEAHVHERSEVPDFWSAPFWPNIPDTPKAFPPEAHVHGRSEVLDFWSAPFWDNIPDKPTFVDSVLIGRGFDGLELDTGQEILVFKLPAGKTLKVWKVMGFCHAAPPGTPGEPARFHMLIDTYTGTLLDKVISAGIGVADGQTYEGNPLCSFTTTEDTLIFLEVYNEDINYSVAGHAAWVISLV